MNDPRQKQRKTAGHDAADVASYLAGDAAAQPFESTANEAAATAAAHARALLEINEGSPKLEALINSYGAGNPAQFGGRLFEFFSETSFNAEAARQDESFSAHMTHFASPFAAADPANPADLRILSPSGEVLAEAQSKSISSTAQRIHELAQAKYEGMQLLIPSDHVSPTETLLDQRIAAANPEFLSKPAYESVQERLTPGIKYQGVSSDPMSTEDLASAAHDPAGAYNEMRSRAQDAQDLAQDQANDAALGALAAAAVGSGMAAASVTALLGAARSVASIRAGTMSPTAAALATCTDSASAFVRASLVGGGGQAISALSSSGALPGAMGAGTLPFALARAGVSVAETSVAYARGDMTGEEAAARMAESLSRTSVVWAASMIGQIAIPIPVVGALIGGTVGSITATVAVKGIQATAALAEDARQERAILAQLEVEVAAALIVLDEERRIIAALAREHESAFNAQILPALDRLDAALFAGQTDSALGELNRLIAAFGQAPLFSSYHEFDSWMADPAASLVISANAQRMTQRYDEAR